MKESGMEKLIKLIVEFQNKTGQTTYDLDMYHYDDKLKLIIIGSDVSKGFIDYIDIFRLIFAPGFIKWLVENDKIDFDKLKPLTGVTEIMLATNYPNGIEVKRRYRLYEQLIMLLSIQDEPISFLISILK